MKHPQSLAAISTTRAAALALSAAFMCESASAQQAVQWRIEDGGNGHWYGIRAGAGSWNAANTAATAIGGQLACVNSTTEHEWIASHLLATNSSLFISGGGWGPHIGGVQAVGAVEPLGGWSWIDGQPLVCTPTLCVMENTGGNQDRLTYQRSGSPFYYEFNDIPAAQVTNTTGSIVEWSADCNSDGVVDYGQILAGELDDANANNFPDCCEQGTPCDPCPADVIENGIIDSIDLSAVLGTWGTNGGDYPRADINHDGIVAAEDLGSVLAGWGACP